MCRRDRSQNAAATEIAPGTCRTATGGDRRLTGFLCYQAEYAVIRFTETLLPDLEEKEVTEILEQYAVRLFSR